jgi:endoglucanase
VCRNAASGGLGFRAQSGARSDSNVMKHGVRHPVKQWRARTAFAKASTGACIVLGGLSVLSACGNGSEPRVPAGGSSGFPGGSGAAGSAAQPAGAGGPSTPPDTSALDPNSPVARWGQLRVEQGRLVSEAGDPVQLKGMSSMWLNWDSANFAESKEGLQWMRDNWNLTVFRAAMGVTEQGSYLTSEQNKANMEGKVRAVVQNAIELGLYVIIDWHDHEAADHPEAAVEFFGRMAAEFGAYPNVFYETFNEPLQVSWSDVLKPYHTQVVEAIRAQDPDNIVIMGTPQWSQRVDQVINDRVEGTNLMYTVHFYSCTHRAQIRGFAQSAAAAGVPIFVTEWGATAADGGTNAAGMVCTDEADQWHQLMNQLGLSWAAWKLDGCTDLSCMFTNRTVPRAGGWTADSGFLNGHATYVIQKMQEPWTP